MPLLNHPSRQPARHLPASERGSVLLMVVAVLALMAIIAVAYTTLGRTDRAASAALVRESRLDDQAAFIKDYLAGVIANDVCATYSERTGNNGWALRREATDYPGTDPLAVSVLPSSIPGTDPGYYRFRPEGTYAGAFTGTGRDWRLPLDPWLASTEPEEVPLPGNTLANTGVFQLDDLRERRTWRSISNFAPDGAFVNLAILRASAGGINADPSLLRAPLSVYDGMGNPTQQDPFTSAPVEVFRPSDFSTLQYLACRILLDNLLPNDPFHINNQWADADGDGLADSRWFEMVDAFDPQNVRWLLPQAGRARIFIAARATDMGGLINVNTASDFLYEPRAQLVGANVVHYPAGLTPADIDLRRFLGTGDMTWVFRDNSNLFGYNAFEQGPGVADYSEYNDPPANPVALDVGYSAYASLRYAINTGQVLPSDAQRPSPSNNPLLQVNADESNPIPNNPNPLTARQRARFYDEFGSDPGSAQNLANGAPYRFRAPFGMADELELRSFNGINDSEQYSKLERALGGREDRRFGPLRENRPRSVEMAGRPDTSTGLLSDKALLGMFGDIRHLMTTENGSRGIIDNPAAGVSAGFIGALEYKTDALELLSKLDKSSGTAPTALDIQSAFELYVGALMPYTDETRYPDAWDRSMMRSRGLSYGESAELAQRLATHSLVNTIDAIDEDLPNAAATVDQNIPTRVALEAVSNAPTHQDFEQTRIVALRDNVRPDVSENLHGGSPRLNIYGIEAQPFIAEVGWFGTFTDTPYGATNGSSTPPDNDYADNQVPPIPPETEPTLGKITLNDDPNIVTNSDFMYEVLAFQLTNPFDRPLQISSGGNVSYYLEYSNRFFALAQRNDEGDGIDPAATITIDPYDTKVFYVCNIKDPKDVARRLEASLYTPTGGTAAPVDPQYLDVWARRQFGDSAVPIPMVHRKSLTVCDASNGTGGGTIEFIDIMADRTVPASTVGDAQQGTIDQLPSSRELRKVAHLWRVSRPAATPTEIGGDILLDRIRDPDAATNGSIGEHRLGSGNMDVGDTEAGNDTDGDAANDQDNTGFSITKWAGFRRPNNSAGFPYQRGSMPPWCLETKTNNLYDPSNSMPLNRGYDEPAGGIGNAGDYRGTQADRRDTLSGLTTAQLNASTINTQMLAKAQNKVGNAIGDNRSVPARPFRDVAVEIHLSGGRTNPQLFSRAGDFLLPLAIGPSYDPIRHDSPTLTTRAAKLEASWMTLSEALALSCDYYSPPALDQFTNRLDPLYRLGHRVDTGTPIRPRLDRGNLVLDDFAPYLDLDNSGDFDPDDDEPLGRGVPLAFNLVDMFMTTSRWKEDATGNLVRRTKTYGGPRFKLPGQININTAPATVMRMLPMFAPDTDPQSWTRIGVTPAEQLYIPGTQTADVAATAVAYRDKTVVMPRPFAAAGTARPPINLRDDNDTDPNTYDGRFAATRIAAIREKPGFKSVGEILALRYSDPAAGVPTRLYENSIDRFADRTGTPTKQPKTGLESTVWKLANGTGVDVDEMVNDYDEQLAVANAALNSVTVRSDVFCVWFLVHGYLPSDVENLAPTDPMIPSIARRYVMVVDRSNVVAVDQKPKILLFQEVPIR